MACLLLGTLLGPIAKLLYLSCLLALCLVSCPSSSKERERKKKKKLAVTQAQPSDR